MGQRLTKYGTLRCRIYTSARTAPEQLRNRASRCAAHTVLARNRDRPDRREVGHSPHISSHPLCRSLHPGCVLRSVHRLGVGPCLRTDTGTHHRTLRAGLVPLTQANRRGTLQPSSSLRHRTSRCRTRPKSGRHSLESVSPSMERCLHAGTWMRGSINLSTALSTRRRICRLGNEEPWPGCTPSKS